MTSEIVTRRFMVERSAAGELMRISVEMPLRGGRNRWRPIWTHKQHWRTGSHSFYGGRSLFDVLQVETLVPPLDGDSVEIPTMSLLMG